LKIGRWTVIGVAAAAAVASVALIGLVRNKDSHRGSDPPEVEVLEAIGAENFSGTRAGSADQYVTVPLTVRNPTSQPIVLRSIRFESTQNLTVDEVFVVGPQSPSRTFNVYDGWPPTMVDEVGATSFDPQRVDGFVIEPNRKGVGEVVAPFETGGRQLVSDQTNDASPVFVIEANDPTRDASGRGVTLSFDLDGRQVTQS
jgi:hypothetical protein